MERENSYPAPDNSRSLDLLPALHPTAQKIKQRQFHRLIGRETLESNSELLANRLGSTVMKLQFSEILPAGHHRVDVQVASRFDIVKQRGFVEVEGQLGGIQQLK